MTWVYVPESCPYLAEAAADCSRPATSSAGKPYAMSSEIHTASKASRREFETACLTTRQSGMTPGLSTGDHGVDAWISLLRDSPARRSLPPAKDWPEAILETCGRIPFASLTRSNRSGCYWRTCRDWFGGVLHTSARFSETWPKAGMIVDGTCFRLSSLGRRTSGSDGFVLPTLRAHEAGGYQYDRGDHSKRILTLTGRLRQMPTLTARDSRTLKGAQPKPNQQGGTNLVLAIGGAVNPTWAEWFMGVPIGWSGSEPLETGRFQSWLRAHGKSSPRDPLDRRDN